MEAELLISMCDSYSKKFKGFRCQSQLSFFEKTRSHWNSSRISVGEEPMEAEV